MAGVAKNILGQRYGRLTVIERAPSPNHKWGAMWRCKCDCGNHTVTRGGGLRAGHTNSCGCLIKDGRVARRKWPSMTKAESVRYSSYLHRCTRDGMKMDLTANEFREMVNSDCYYCGDSPNPINGIDRVDTTEGYSKDNCVPCCAACNRMKRDSDVGDFIGRCVRIAERSSVAFSESESEVA